MAVPPVSPRTPFLTPTSSANSSPTVSARPSPTSSISARVKAWENRASVVVKKEINVDTKMKSDVVGLGIGVEKMASSSKEEEGLRIQSARVEDPEVRTVLPEEEAVEEERVQEAAPEPASVEKPLPPSPPSPDIALGPPLVSTPPLLPEAPIKRHPSIPLHETPETSPLFHTPPSHPPSSFISPQTFFPKNFSKSPTIEQSRSRTLSSGSTSTPPILPDVVKLDPIRLSPVTTRTMEVEDVPPSLPPTSLSDFPLPPASSSPSSYSKVSPPFTPTKAHPGSHTTRFSPSTSSGPRPQTFKSPPPPPQAAINIAEQVFGSAGNSSKRSTSTKKEKRSSILGSIFSSGGNKKVATSSSLPTLQAQEEDEMEDVLVASGAMQDSKSITGSTRSRSTSASATMSGASGSGGEKSLKEFPATRESLATFQILGDNLSVHSHTLPLPTSNSASTPSSFLSHFGSPSSRGEWKTRFISLSSVPSSPSPLAFALHSFKSVATGSRELSRLSLTSSSTIYVPDVENDSRVKGKVFPLKITGVGPEGREESWLFDLERVATLKNWMEVLKNVVKDLQRPLWQRETKPGMIFRSAKGDERTSRAASEESPHGEGRFGRSPSFTLSDKSSIVSGFGKRSESSEGARVGLGFDMERRGSRDSHRYHQQMPLQPAPASPLIARARGRNGAAVPKSPPRTLSQGTVDEFGDGIGKQDDGDTQHPFRQSLIRSKSMLGPNASPGVPTGSQESHLSVPSNRSTPSYNSSRRGSADSGVQRSPPSQVRHDSDSMSVASFGSGYLLPRGPPPTTSLPDLPPIASGRPSSVRTNTTSSSRSNSKRYSVVTHESSGSGTGGRSAAATPPLPPPTGALPPPPSGAPPLPPSGLPSPRCQTGIRSPPLLSPSEYPFPHLRRSPSRSSPSLPPPSTPPPSLPPPSAPLPPPPSSLSPNQNFKTGHLLVKNGVEVDALGKKANEGNGMLWFDE